MVWVIVLTQCGLLFYDGRVHSHQKGDRVQMPKADADSWAAFGIVRIEQ